jgi:LuxR family maltose regulon positive regulatory protein
MTESASHLSKNLSGELRWLVRAKLDPPSCELQLIHRAHLLSMLDQYLQRHFCMIVAPAGFGKTSLLAQWRRHLLDTGKTVAWLTLDEADSNQHQFLSYVILSLTTAGIDLSRLGSMSTQGMIDSELKPSIQAALDAIASHPAHVVLILDDYHRPQSPPVNQILCDMITGAPPNFSIVMSGRTRPLINLPQLIATGHAVEIDADALRFSPDEVREAFNRPLSDQRLSQLHERTEGWPVVVQLARALIGNNDSECSALDHFTGGNGHIAAYLTEQVLTTLPEDIQSFLIRTSIFERFSPELADTVTMRRDSLDVMRRLEPLKALIMPSGTRDWYRYHHLFAECLQDHLRRRFADEVRGLHGRASAWFAEQGDVVEAVKHARAAGDYDRCALLVEQAGGWELILFGGIGYLRNLLHNIPQSLLGRYPRLQLAKAYLGIKDGHLREARALLDAARARYEPDNGNAPLARDLLNVGSLLDVYEDLPIRPSDMAAVNDGLARVPPSDAITIGILACQRVLYLMALGHLSEAEACIEGMMRAMRQGRTVLGLNYCFLHAGLIALYQGRFQAADTHIAVARRMAEDNFGADSGLKFLADFLYGVLRQWQGRLTGEEQQRFLTAAEHVESYDGWLELYANGLDVEADFQPAAAITRAERIIEERGLKRLELLVLSHRLREAVRERRAADAEALIQRLRQRLPDRIWRDDPFLWRPFVESRLALAAALSGRDRAQALRLLDDANDCCTGIGVVVFRIKVLVLRAHLLDMSGDRAGASAVLLDALYLAVPERIFRPFERERGITPLLRSLVRRSRDNHLDILVLDFVNELLARPPEGYGTRDFNISPREQEVLEELASGLANKEIARVLDMTEHTVKFHLKNIFAKLQVERRAQAIAKARELRLL